LPIVRVATGEGEGSARFSSFWTISPNACCDRPALCRVHRSGSWKIVQPFSTPGRGEHEFSLRLGLPHCCAFFREGCSREKLPDPDGSPIGRISRVTNCETQRTILECGASTHPSKRAMVNERVTPGPPGHSSQFSGLIGFAPHWRAVSTKLAENAETAQSSAHQDVQCWEKSSRSCNLTL
jgi:hypothetical protein